MKQIILDFLRRWWGGYLLAMLFVGAIAAAMDLEWGFVFVGILTLPFAFELGRKPVGVMATLPVSRRTIALSYWYVAVLLPVLLMAAIVALDAMIFRSVLISSKKVAMVLFGSLAIAGSSHCFFTFVSPDVRGNNPADVLVISMLGLWFPAIIFGGMLPKIFYSTQQSPATFLSAGLLGLFLTVWGYSRREKLLFGRTRKRPGSGWFSVQKHKRIPSLKPRMARFGGVYFDVVSSAFLFGLIFPMFLLLFKTPMDEHFWLCLFMYGAAGSTMLLSGGVRLLRSLPLSTGQLALALLLMPLFSILAVIAGAAVVQWINLGHFLSRDSATFLIPMTGATCIASSLIVPFGGSGKVPAILLAQMASLVLCETILNVQWPAAFWWILGLSLMVAAFFLNRHWLRSSYSYRPSTGDFLRRQR